MYSQFHPMERPRSIIARQTYIINSLNKVCVECVSDKRTGMTKRSCLCNFVQTGISGLLLP